MVCLGFEPGTADEPTGLWRPPLFSFFNLDISELEIFAGVCRPDDNLTYVRIAVTFYSFFVQRIKKGKASASRRK